MLYCLLLHDTAQSTFSTAIDDSLRNEMPDITDINPANYSYNLLLVRYYYMIEYFAPPHRQYYEMLQHRLKLKPTIYA